MEYQKIKGLLNNTPNELSKFRTRNWIEMINQEECIMRIVRLSLNQQC